VVPTKGVFMGPCRGVRRVPIYSEPTWPSSGDGLVGDGGTRRISHRGPEVVPYPSGPGGDGRRPLPLLPYVAELTSIDSGLQD